MQDTDCDTTAEASIRRLAAVPDQIEDTVVITDLQGDIIYVNPAMERRSGYTADELIGQNPRVQKSGSHPEEFYRELWDTLLAGETFRGDFINRNKDGSLRYEEKTISPIRDESGEITCFAATGRDVTDRRAAEQALADLEQFAFSASHDLQTPLRSIARYVQMLDRRYADQLDERAREYIQRAVAGSKSMETLLHSLLEYFSVGSRGEEYRPTDTREVVDDVIEGLSTSLVEAGAEIVRSGLPVVTADGTQLRQVFHNLIDNAVKFRGEEPLRIEVSAECHDHVWAFSVQDNGIGIEPEYHDQIFGIFKRLHGGGQYPGTGAGLALCMRIIERHRGRMWVDSGPGAGSCFCFSLPA